MKMKRGKRGAARLKFYRLQARRESGAAKAAEQPQRARRAAADNGGVTIGRRAAKVADGDNRGQRRSDHETARQPQGARRAAADSGAARKRRNGESGRTG